jgi:hypothetical protein
LISDLRDRTDRQRVEIGARGRRTHIASIVAGLLILDGSDPTPAATWVRGQFGPHALITVWEREFLQAFAARTMNSELGR